jgi:hypothetical protein
MANHPVSWVTGLLPVVMCNFLKPRASFRLARTPHVKRSTQAALVLSLGFATPPLPIFRQNGRQFGESYEEPTRARIHLNRSLIRSFQLFRRSAFLAIRNTCHPVFCLGEDFLYLRSQKSGYLRSQVGH